MEELWDLFLTRLLDVKAGFVAVKALLMLQVTTLYTIKCRCDRQN